VKVLRGKLPSNIWIDETVTANPYQKLRMKIETTKLDVEILDSPPPPPKPAHKPIPASASGSLKGGGEASLQPPNGMSSWHPQSLANAPTGGGMRSEGGSLTPPSMGDSPTDQSNGLGRASFPPPMMAPLPPQAGAAPAFSANAAPFNAAAPAFNASAPAFNAAAPAFNVSAAPFNSGNQMPPQPSIQGGPGFPGAPYGVGAGVF